MSSSYALPTAPPVEGLYPDLPTDPAATFRLTEISRIEKEISNQVEHYRLVLKKYKKARKVVHYSAVGLGSVSAVLSSGAIAASLTGVGVIIGAPVAGIAAFAGISSAILAVINKNIERKVDKHSRLLSLATAKHDSINCCVSQALNDNSVSDKEFELVTREIAKYRQLKEALRSKFVKKPAASPTQFDIEKIREQVRQEFRKKLVDST